MHAVNIADGIDVVRYDMAGKWYLEPHDDDKPRQHVSVTAASAYVGEVLLGGKGVANTGLHGGARFDYLLGKYLHVKELEGDPVTEGARREAG